ncbi:exonuclease domain-containing protein [Marinobacterium aestuariivivens]|uniref:Exonuclease domain-containing protein n=1 Tax=Marinobacterium aestuariivivens TaxID=1698799 RepID=A0ABW2A372_9GAMM
MDDLWILDIEASGLSPISYPIEIGLVNGEQEYQRLIIPEESWEHWNVKSEALHGLSRQDLYEKGKSVDVVAKELNELLASKIVYSDHEDWDSFWLRRLFETVGREQKFYVMDINTLLDSSNLKTFVTRFDELKEAKDHRTHRALDDARIIHRAAILALNSY